MAGWPRVFRAVRSVLRERPAEPTRLSSNGGASGAPARTDATSSSTTPRLVGERGAHVGHGLRRRRSCVSLQPRISALGIRPQDGEAAAHVARRGSRRGRGRRQGPP